jgi:hypothetical protein
MSVLAAMAVMIVLIALSFLSSGFWTRLRTRHRPQTWNALLGSIRCSIHQVAHYAQRETTSASR